MKTLSCRKSQGDFVLQPRVARMSNPGEKTAEACNPNGVAPEQLGPLIPGQSRIAAKTRHDRRNPVGVASLGIFNTQGSSASAGTTPGWRAQSLRDWLLVPTVNTCWPYRLFFG